MVDASVAVAATDLASIQASQMGFKAIGAGLAVGLTGVGTGVAEMGIGASAVGAIAEDREFLGLGLVFTVIPESIVIFGLVIALLLLFL
jgi:V/A-type H+-transporting ATPase subunit K